MTQTLPDIRTWIQPHFPSLSPLKPPHFLLSAVPRPELFILSRKNLQNCEDRRIQFSRRKLFFIFLLAQDLLLAVRTAQIRQWYLSWSFLESVNKQTWGWSRRVRLHVTCAISHLNEWVCHGNEDHQLFHLHFFLMCLFCHWCYIVVSKDRIFLSSSIPSTTLGPWSGDIYFYDGASNSSMHQDSSYHLLNK